jgi:hypothetical protein
MTVILIIIGIFIFLFLIVRPILNKTNSNISNKNWDWALNDQDIKEMFKNNFKIDNINYIVTNLLKPLNINYTKFISNLSWLHTDGRSNQLSSNFNTPSITHFTRPIDRPHMPLWYIAAFPDICKWNNDENTTEEDIMSKLYENISFENDIPDIEDFNWGMNEAIPIIKKTVDNYLKNIKPYLETR